MRSQFVCLFLILMAAAFAGCSQEELSPEELKQTIEETAEKVDTYKFDMNMKMKTVISNESGSIEMITFSSGNGIVDQENRKMVMKLKTNMSAPGEESLETEMEMYYIGNEVYMKMDVGIPEFPARWMKMEIPEEYLGSQNQLEQQLELLNVSEIEVLGSEKIDGVDCYVLKVTPDMKKLWEVISNKPGIGEQVKEIGDFNLGDIIKETSVKYWIAKDAKFPMKTFTKMKMEFTSESLNISDSVTEELSMIMDSEVEVKYYDYNKPAEIELPEEAKNAEEFPVLV